MRKLIFALILISCGSAFGASKTLKNTTNIKDNWISQAAPTTNYDTATALTAQTNLGSVAYILMAFPAWPDSIGGGKVIDSVLLGLYVISATATTWTARPLLKPDSTTVNSYNYWGSTNANDWGTVGAAHVGYAENTTDGASSADYDTTTANAIFVSATITAGSYNIFDITNYARKWYWANGFGPSERHKGYGIRIQAAGSSKNVIIGGSQNSDAAKQPYLYIVYHDSTNHYVSMITDATIDEDNTNTVANGTEVSASATLSGESFIHRKKAIYGAKGLADSIRATLGYSSMTIDSSYLWAHVSYINGASVYPSTNWILKPSFYESHITWNKWYDADSAVGTAGWQNLTTGEVSNSTQNRSNGSGYDYTTYSRTWDGSTLLDTNSTGPWQRIDLTYWLQKVMDTTASDHMFMQIIMSTATAAEVRFNSNSAIDQFKPFVTVWAHAKAGAPAANGQNSRYGGDRYRSKRY